MGLTLSGAFCVQTKFPDWTSSTRGSLRACFWCRHGAGACGVDEKNGQRDGKGVNEAVPKFIVECAVLWPTNFVSHLKKYVFRGPGCRFDPRTGCRAVVVLLWSLVTTRFLQVLKSRATRQETPNLVPFCRRVRLYSFVVDSVIPLFVE